MTASIAAKDAIQVAPLPGLQVHQLSIGFADMDGFMKVAESGSDADIAAIVQTCYRAIGDAVLRNRGRIWKYLGDAVMFSCPDPVSAIKAAHEIAALRFRHRDQEVRFHVSVATGPVVQGSFGHSTFRNEDIFGHTIHRAALLGRDAKADPSHVALDEATRRAVDKN
ncbi:MAG TPA: adenylate/guanylate cyclase domain-containing protein [Chloroflexota bacterium]|nr:adenylate/guanylate cyclase domain-containing protein [Chloroflexota bacterium]